MHPVRKPRSCVPCHKRKVRCDATQVGTPCTRCVDKSRVDVCVLVDRPKKKIAPRRSESGIVDDEVTISDTQPSRKTSQKDASNPGASVQLQTRIPDIHRPRSQQLAFQLTNDLPSVSSRRVVVEYYRDLNACTILGGALKQPRRAGLVESYSGPSLTLSMRERDLARLDEMDRDYLTQRHVHEMPTTQICESLLSLFFRHVHTYLPIIDHGFFMRNYRQDQFSTFVLYAMFVVALSHAPDSLMQSIGSFDAQTEYFTRAKILFDFGCETNELNLLQGSILLGSFQHYLDPIKNAGFWFSNATRLALQMGIHRSEIASEVDQSTYKLLRRIWWVLVQRDVYLVITGIDSARRLVDEDSDVAPMQLIDLVDVSLTAVIANRSRSYFIHSCKLASLGARFIHLFQAERMSPTMTQTREFADALDTWLASLPKELEFPSKARLNPSDACIIALHVSFGQLSTVFYRTICKRLSTSNGGAVAVYKEQLRNANSDACSLVSRAIMHDALRHVPLSLIDCIAQLYATRVEITLEYALNGESINDLNESIAALTSYLETVGKKWAYARTLCRMFDMARSSVEHTA